MFPSVLPLSTILLSFSLVLQQLALGVYAQASQAPPTTFGTATGSQSVTGSVTRTAISGSTTGSATSGSANSSSPSASTTNTANLPTLSGFSPCVVNCFQTAIGMVGCNNVVPAECYCTRSNYTSTLLSCMRTDCPEELSTVESLANQFCAIASPSTSLSFSITAFPSSTSSGNGTATGTRSQTSPGSSQASDSATTSNAAMGMKMGEVKVGGGLVGMGLALVGVVLGAVVVL